jgi:hypothetical protein
VASRAEYTNFIADVRNAPDPSVIASSFVRVLDGEGWNPGAQKALFSIWLGFNDMFDGRVPDGTAQASADLRQFANEWLVMTPDDDDALNAYLERWTLAYGPPAWH